MELQKHLKGLQLNSQKSQETVERPNNEPQKIERIDIVLYKTKPKTSSFTFDHKKESRAASKLDIVLSNSQINNQALTKSSEKILELSKIQMFVQDDNTLDDQKDNLSKNEKNDKSIKRVIPLDIKKENSDSFTTEQKPDKNSNENIKLLTRLTCSKDNDLNKLLCKNQILKNINKESRLSKNQCKKLNSLNLNYDGTALKNNLQNQELFYINFFIF